MNIIGKLINREQLLQLALHVSSTIPDESDSIREIADQIIVYYIMEDMEKEEKDINHLSIEEISRRTGNLLADFVLTKLVHEGKMEVDLNADDDFKYSLTDEGKEWYRDASKNLSDDRE